MSADPVGEALRALAQTSGAMLDAYERGAHLPDALADADDAQDSLSALLSARAAHRALIDRQAQRSRATPLPTPTRHFTDGPGGRVWHCTGCGVTGPWGDGWEWFGTADDQVEYVACPECPRPEQPREVAHA